MLCVKLLAVELYRWYEYLFLDLTDRCRPICPGDDSQPLVLELADLLYDYPPAWLG
jgi:hypothetical protein